MAEKRRTADMLVCVAAVVIASLVTILLFRLWSFAWATPMHFGDDTFGAGINIKGVIDEGWYLSSNRLAAPGVYTLHDFTMSETATLLLAKGIGLFTRDWAVVVNVLYMLSFPLAALSAAFAALRLSVRPITSFATGLLFAFTPYHWMAEEIHVYLSDAVWVVPLAAMVVFWLASDEQPFIRQDAERRYRPDHWSARSIGAGLVAIALGVTGVYYAFFASFFALVAGVVASVNRRDARALLAPLAFIATVGVTLAANLVPSFAYWAAHGSNPAAVARVAGEPDIYGLRVAWLLMPISGHRLAFLSRLPEGYQRIQAWISVLLVNESGWSRLGGLASLGLLISLAIAVFRPRMDWLSERRRALVNDAAVLSLSAILLATTGSFGVLLSAVLHSIRAYTRVSIFIAFFCLIVLALLADEAESRLRGSSRTLLVVALVPAIVVLGVLDETPSRLAPSSETLSRYAEATRFVGDLEARLPARAAVFQLPYLPYPESGGLLGMNDYDPAIGYLASRQLRWSYGAIKGRQTAAWQERVSAMPAPELVRTLRASGFTALWVDRAGYSDHGVSFEADLRPLLGAPSSVSSSGRWAVYAVSARSAAEGARQ